jgi:RNA polymerase sigma factor (sigma-70 family)
MPNSPSSRGARKGSFRPGGTSAASSNLSPTELVDACVERRPGSWEEFLRRYANLIYSTILKVGLPDADQEDAFQSAILVIYADLGRLRSRESIASWIVGITYRQAINRIRARTRARETPLEEDEDMPGRSVIDPLAPGDLPDQSRVELERAQQIAEALERLPERCRRLLRILFYEDPAPDYGEISRREGLPVGSIGPTRARCLEKMRRVYEERGWAG